MTEELPAQRQSVAIVTGPAGAGRSTTIRAMEDLGFEAIDNLPLSLLERLLTGAPPPRPLAIGVDPRTRDFSTDGVRAILARLAEDPELDGSLVYIDCNTDTLLRRFSETRRRHPLAPHETPLAGIERERAILAPLRGIADVLVDTSTMSPHDCRDEISRWYSRAGAADLALSIQSFSFKRGTPRSADMVLDCRFLQNPHWQADLRPKTGQDPAVGAFVAKDPLFQPFVDQIMGMLNLLLPAFKAEGKAYFTLAFGCTGGRHRSVHLAETAGFLLAEAGWRVSIRHRELEQAPGGAAPSEVVKS